MNLFCWTNEQADGRTNERADARTGGRTDGRSSGLADGRTDGRAGGRTMSSTVDEPGVNGNPSPPILAKIHVVGKKLAFGFSFNLFSRANLKLASDAVPPQGIEAYIVSENLQ